MEDQLAGNRKYRRARYDESGEKKQKASNNRLDRARERQDQILKKQQKRIEKGIDGTGDGSSAKKKKTLVNIRKHEAKRLKRQKDREIKSKKNDENSKK